MALADAVDRAVGAEVAGGIERRVLCDLAPKALLSAAAGADLLTIGARGVGGFRGLLLGSVSQACLHHTTVPLAIVRAPDVGPGGPPETGPAPPAAGGRIVVGVEFSESARRALRWALAEARLREARVDVVHGWQIPFATPSPLAGLPLDDDFLEKQVRAELDRIIDGADAATTPDRSKGSSCAVVPRGPCSTRPRAPTWSSSAPGASAGSGASCSARSPTRWPTTSGARSSWSRDGATVDVTIGPGGRPGGVRQ